MRLRYVLVFILPPRNSKSAISFDPVDQIAQKLDILKALIFLHKLR
jgi:hypothetical protein